MAADSKPKHAEPLLPGDSVEPKTIAVDAKTIAAASSDGEIKHGEYKTPRGKLTVVDFELHEGRMRRVQLSGDFFAYPDDLPGRLQRQMEGVPEKTTVGELTQIVQAGLLDGDEILGSSPFAIATAVTRGFEKGATE